MNIHRVAMTYLWLKLIVVTLLWISVPLTVVFIPAWKFLPVQIAYGAGVVLAIALNVQLGRHRLRWPWLVLALLVPLLGLFIAYVGEQKAVKAAAREHSYAL